VGGLASVAGGGKFADGAVTGAFQYLVTTGGASLQSVDERVEDGGLLGFAQTLDAGPRHDNLAGPNVVCEAELQCSTSEIVDNGSRFGYPGQSSQDPIPSTGGTYMVKDMALGIWGGFVNTTVSPDGLTITNQTTLFHFFCCGTIVRTFTQDDNGTWYATT